MDQIEWISGHNAWLGEVKSNIECIFNIVRVFDRYNTELLIDGKIYKQDDFSTLDHAKLFSETWLLEYLNNNFKNMDQIEWKVINNDLVGKPSIDSEYLFIISNADRTGTEYHLSFLLDNKITGIKHVLHNQENAKQQAELILREYMTNKPIFVNKVGKLKELLNRCKDDDSTIMFQVVGENSGVWNVYAEFTPIVRNGTIACFRISHPELIDLPEISNKSIIQQEVDKLPELSKCNESIEKQKEYVRTIIQKLGLNDISDIIK